MPLMTSGQEMTTKFLSKTVLIPAGGYSCHVYFKASNPGQRQAFFFTKIKRKELYLHWMKGILTLLWVLYIVNAVNYPHNVVPLVFLHKQSIKASIVIRMRLPYLDMIMKGRYKSAVPWLVYGVCNLHVPILPQAQPLEIHTHSDVQVPSHGTTTWHGTLRNSRVIVNKTPAVTNSNTNTMQAAFKATEVIFKTFSFLCALHISLLSCLLWLSICFLHNMYMYLCSLSSYRHNMSNVQVYYGLAVA